MRREMYPLKVMTITVRVVSEEEPERKTNRAAESRMTPPLR